MHAYILSSATKNDQGEIIDIDNDWNVSNSNQQNITEFMQFVEKNIKSIVHNQLLQIHSKYNESFNSWKTMINTLANDEEKSKL